jgi:hypothetical protein
MKDESGKMKGNALPGAKTQEVCVLSSFIFQVSGFSRPEHFR